MDQRSLHRNLAGLRENGIIDIQEHDCIMWYLTTRPSQKDLRSYLARLGLLDSLEEYIEKWEV